VIQWPDRADFALKPISELLCGNLDGNVASDLQVVRLSHLAHPAFAEQRDDFVRAEFCARLQVHGLCWIASIHYKKSAAQMAGSAIGISLA